MGTKQFDNYADLITFTRASGATYLDSEGVLKTASTNIPRIEYDADGNRLGLLVEEQRTNLLTYSEDFANAYWPKNAVTVAASSEVDPSGGASAYELIESATNANHLLNKAGLAGANTYSEFIFAKANTRSWMRLQSQSPINSWVNVNLATGEKGLSGGSEDSYSIQDVGNGWYKISLSFTATSATGYQLFVLDSDRGGSSPSYLGDGSSSILIYGAQFEAGSFPTSYIPTSGSTATRAADVASIPTSAFGYNQSAGSVVVEARTNNSASTDDYVFQIDDGTNNNRYVVRLNNTSGTTTFVVNSGSASATNSGSVISAGDTFKVAFAFSDSDQAVSLDGASVQTLTSAIPSELITLNLGSTGTSAFLDGHIKSIKYYPRRLSNAQLQELTQ